MKKIILLLSIICFLCSQKSKVDNSLGNSDSTNEIQKEIREIVEIKKDTLPLLDTTIFIKSAKQKVDSPKPVSRQMVIDDLYAHFKKKGYYLKHSVVEKSDDGTNILVQEIDVPLDLDDYSELECINIDTTMVYLTDLNNDNQIDAIIEYYDFPCYASSHCNQPHKMIMMNKNGKFIFQNKYVDFISPSYSIDSVKTYEEETIIYGYDYFCHEHKVAGYFKLHLKQSN